MKSPVALEVMTQEKMQRFWLEMHVKKLGAKVSLPRVPLACGPRDVNLPHQMYMAGR